MAEVVKEKPLYSKWWQDKDERIDIIIKIGFLIWVGCLVTAMFLIRV